MPINLIHETPELLKVAATVEAHYTLSVADAWISEAAELGGVTLAHKDSVFSAAGVAQVILPVKATKTVW